MGNVAPKVVQDVKPALRAALKASEKVQGAAGAAPRVAAPPNTLPQRLMPSGPRAGPEIHEKDALTVKNLASLDSAIVDRPDDGVGAKNFTLWQAMQLNPRLLDTAEVLKRSNTQLIAAQMSVGLLPPGTVMEDGSAPLGAGTSAALAADSGEAPGDALVPAEHANALVPVSQTVDGLLLLRPPPAGVAAWGPRPAENSPYDQLVLHNADEDFMLDRVELFELYARRRADPDYWTAPRLAELYGTKAEWVEVLLESAAPPVLCAVDGEMYGGYSLSPSGTGSVC